MGPGWWRWWSWLGWIVGKAQVSSWSCVGGSLAVVGVQGWVLWPCMATVATVIFVARFPSPSLQINAMAAGFRPVPIRIHDGWWQLHSCGESYLPFPSFDWWRSTVGWCLERNWGVRRLQNNITFKGHRTIARHPHVFVLVLGFRNWNFPTSFIPAFQRLCECVGMKLGPLKDLTAARQTSPYQVVEQDVLNLNHLWKI